MPSERQRLLDLLDEYAIEDLIILSETDIAVRSTRPKRMEEDASWKSRPVRLIEAFYAKRRTDHFA